MIEAELHIPYKVLRWDYWTDTVKFKESLKNIEHKYATDAQYTVVVNEVVNNSPYAKASIILQNGVTQYSK
jgi:hypothetical protein